MKRYIILIFVLYSQLFSGVSGEIYTNGYHEYIVSVLNAISGLAASNNETLIKIATSIAILILTIKILFNQSSRAIAGFEILKYGTVILAIQALFISAPDDDNHAYVVIDKISNQTTEVRQIPKGIGEFLTMFSNLEDGIMSKMELYLTTPNSLSYRQAGLGFTISTQMEIMRSDIVDENLKKTFHEYILNCKVDGDFSANSQNLNDILASEGEEIINKLESPKSLLTLVYSDTNPLGEIKECKEAWIDIKAGIGVESINHIEAYSKARGLIAATYSAKVAEAVMITGSTSATISAKKQLESAIARNATLDAIKKVATFNGVSDSLLAKQVSISELSMTNASILSNYQAQGTLPILKAVCMSFLIVLSWIVAILAIATMNIQYIKFIIMLNIWLMLWSPLFQVLNYAIDLMVDDALSLYSNGISASTQIGVYEILGGKLAVITNLVWSVPILAFAIAKGSEMGMVSFMNGMLSPVQNAAHHAAKTDVQSATTGNDSYLASDGSLSQYGGSSNSQLTGVGGQTTKLNDDGNTISTIKGTGVTKASSGLNGNLGAAIDGNGNINVSNDQASASLQNSASTSLSLAESNVKSMQSSLVKGNENAVSSIANVGENNTLTRSDGSAFKLSESTSETIGSMTSSASKEAFGASSKSALVDSIMESSDAKNALNLKADSSKSVVGAAVAGLSGLSGSLNSAGQVSLSSSDGTKFELSKDSSYGQEYSQNFNKSLSNQVSSSKENSLAYSDALSAFKGESQSDSNSTSRKMQDAYSEQESASQTFQDTKSLGSSQNANLLNSAFNNYFDNNSNWDDANNEEKSNFMVNQMKTWSQDIQGINNMSDFISDNAGTPKLENTVDTINSIDNRSNDLKNDVGSLDEVQYNPSSINNTSNEINGTNSNIQGSSASNGNLTSQVNGNLKDDGSIQSTVNDKTDKAGNFIDSHRDNNANKVDESILINTADGMNTLGEGAKDVYKSIAGKDDHVNADLKQYADNNKVVNDSTYSNAKLGNNNLVEHGWINDDINSSAMQNASTETLARIYNHDLAEDTLSDSSKSSLKNELTDRGYDTNNNEFSSNYENQTIKADSIIPNGDNSNVGSSIKSNNELNSIKSDFNNTFKPSF